MILQVDSSKMICKNMMETKCKTKYVEKEKGMFVGDTACEKIPRQFCAATGCKFESGDNFIFFCDTVCNVV